MEAVEITEEETKKSAYNKDFLPHEKISSSMEKHWGQKVPRLCPAGSEQVWKLNLKAAGFACDELFIYWLSLHIETFLMVSTDLIFKCTFL